MRLLHSALLVAACCQHCRVVSVNRTVVVSVVVVVDVAAAVAVVVVAVVVAVVVVVVVVAVVVVAVVVVAVVVAEVVAEVVVVAAAVVVFFFSVFCFLRNCWLGVDCSEERIDCGIVVVETRWMLVLAGIAVVVHGNSSTVVDVVVVVD